MQSKRSIVISLSFLLIVGIVILCFVNASDKTATKPSTARIVQAQSNPSDAPQLSAVAAIESTASIPDRGGSIPSPSLTLQFNDSAPDKLILSLLDFANNSLSKKGVEFIDFMSQNSKPIFDLEETSKRTLAHRWSKLTDEDRATFLQGYGKYFLTQHASAIAKLNQCPIKLNTNEEAASVRVDVLSTSPECREFPLSYYLHYLPEERVWRIFDFSAYYIRALTSNRFHFNEILQKEDIVSLNRKIRAATPQNLPLFSPP